MPVVTVLDKPSGLPIAITGSPTLTADESAKVAGFRPLGGFLIWITARSVVASAPRTVAVYVRPSARTTEIVAPAPAPVTTWLLVRIRPEVSRITPEPSSPVPSAATTRTETTLGSTAAAAASQLTAVPLVVTSGVDCCAAAAPAEVRADAVVVAGAVVAVPPNTDMPPAVSRLAMTAVPAPTAMTARHPGRPESRREGTSGVAGAGGIAVIWYSSSASGSSVV